ncbi:substrate-binding periplasmic protein [Colwellia sp. MEBiC06753]
MCQQVNFDIKHINIKSIALVISLVMMSITNAIADPIKGKPLTIVTDIAPPLQFMNGNKLDGYTTRIVRDVLSKSQLEAKFAVYPWARAFKLATAQKNTLIYPLIRTQEREDEFIWIGRLMTMKMSVIRMDTANHQPLTSLEDAKSLKLGIMRNDYIHQFLDQQGFEEFAHYHLASDLPQLMALLYTNKIDAIIADLPLTKVMALSLGYEPQLLTSVYDIPNQDVDIYLAASKLTDQTIINQLKQHMPYAG